MSKEILDLLSEHGTPFIASLLGIFFLVAAFVKGSISRRHRLRHQDAEAASANGGTADAPVHLSNPFEEKSAPPAPPTDEPAAPAPSPSQPAATEPGERYVWE